MIPSSVQGVKDPALPQLQCRWQLWLRFSPWPRNFHMPWENLKKKMGLEQRLDLKKNYMCLLLLLLLLLLSSSSLLTPPELLPLLFSLLRMPFLPLDTSSSSFRAGPGIVPSISPFFFFFFFLLFKAALTAYGSSQARGTISATATNLYHSHRNTRSEPRVQPTP